MPLVADIPGPLRKGKDVVRIGRNEEWVLNIWRRAFGH